MKSLVIAIAATTMLLAAPVYAQDAGGAAPAGAPAAAGGAAGGKGGKMKQAMQACRSEVASQGLKGPDKKKAIEDCVTKEHPELAGRMACRDEAKSKGLSGDELKSYVKTCARGKNHG